jgi:hypothetical protein
VYLALALARLALAAAQLVSIDTAMRLNLTYVAPQVQEVEVQVIAIRELVWFGKF